MSFLILKSTPEKFTPVLWDPWKLILTFYPIIDQSSHRSALLKMSFDSETETAGNFKLSREFAFDYDLLDKLLQGIQDENGVISDSLITPVPGTDERNNRLGSEWIKQLEQDLVQFIDDDSISQTPSNSTSPTGEDLFEREWNDFANILEMSQENFSSFTTTPLHQQPSELTEKYSTNEALNLNRELQGQIKTILDRSNFLEQQQRELERVTDLLNSQMDKKLRRKYPNLPFWPQEVPSLAVFDKVVQEARAIIPLQNDPRLEEMNRTLKGYQKHLKIVPRWTIKERCSLAQGIRAQNEKILLGIIQSKGANSLEECRKIIDSFNEIDLLMNVNGIDWENISQFFVQTRTATDCRLQWTINDHPMINKSPLFEEENREEIEKLGKIVPKIIKQVTSKGLPEGFCSPWQVIASQLGTNRTAIQCFMMFQRKINPNFLKGKWTAEEDQLLMNAVKIFGTQNWQAVAQMIDGRTGQQCLHRYEKAIKPEIKRGRWSPSEDELLKVAVKPFVEVDGVKINWSIVKQGVPGRTDVQCRERWVNVLDPSLTAAPFTPEEDKLLVDLVQVHGSGNWSKISQEMGKKRTDNQLWRRWKQIGRSKGNNRRVRTIKKVKK